MITTHLIFFFFGGAPGGVAGEIDPRPNINSFPINGVADYAYLTGDINGPTQVWDTVPSNVLDRPTSVWTIVESPSSPTWEPQEP
jgi:hypothetical protein